MPETVARTGHFFKSISGVVRKGLKSDKLAQLLEFPVLFLGAKPSKTPAFYCFMNYADIVLGTWHPKGGMYKLIEALQKLAEEQGVNITSNAAISRISVTNNRAKSIEVNGNLLITILLSALQIIIILNN
jgi:phytoene desaturase